MLPSAQEYFARHQFSPERYQLFLQRLDEAVDMHIEYRVAELPLFLSQDFKHKLERAAVDILMQCTDPAYLKRSNSTLEERYTVPNETSKPLFAVVDFAIAQAEDGTYEPRLIELQGFPSLYGYQYYYAKTVKEVFGLDPAYGITLGGLNEQEYVELLRKTILGGHEPDHVALLEYKPAEQKTRPDFLSLRKLIGLEETDILSVKKEGRTLYHQRKGRWVPIRRIFNRAIIDELDEQAASIPFSWTDDLDVEWAGHPNWYFRISKFSLPYLSGSAVPKTFFIHELDGIPDDLERYVLKPLYSFAGKGVNVAPTRADIEAIPAEQREQWVLMEKVQYAECIYTPEGMNKAEVRAMMIWPDDRETPLPVMSLVRTGRGPMMGVRYNNVPWSGSSGGLFGTGNES
jgi:hypothetical protein